MTALRILNEIQFRRFPTSLEFLRNHVRLEKNLKNGRNINEDRLQSCIEYGKRADKEAKASLSLTNISVPDEPQFRSEIGKLLRVLIQRNAKGLSLQMTSSIVLHRSRQKRLDAGY
jgi:hypothetical protein